jgi:AraC family transcriptional regulator, transcriptional activator of pobA
MLAKKIKRVPVHSIKTKEMHHSGFDIIPLGRSQNNRTYDATAFHRHTFFELFIFLSGGGQHEIDFHKYPVKKNAVHFVAPGQIHRLHLKETKGYVICFTEEFFSLPTSQQVADKFPFFDGLAEPVLHLSTVIAHLIMNQLELLLAARTATLNDEITRAHLNIILLTLKQQAQTHKTEEDAGKRSLVQQFRKLVNNNFTHDLPMAEYAGRLNITPNYLNSLCREREGKTATTIIQERVLLEAKRLLYGTGLSVKEIAFELNFASVAYFIRYFKKGSGLTPAAYREQIAKNR